MNPAKSPVLLCGEGVECSSKQHAKKGAKLHQNLHFRLCNSPKFITEAKKYPKKPEKTRLLSLIQEGSFLSPRASADAARKNLMTRWYSK